MDDVDLLQMRRSLAAQLSLLPTALPSVTVGFDGFVDEMVRVVGERLDPERFTPVPDIGAFGQLISAAAGHSSLREIVVHDTVAGGCALNLGDGLAALGLTVDAFATLGVPAHPAFGAITQRFRRVESWGSQPGRTLAFEFNDGKLMFSAVSQLAELTATKALELVARGEFAASCRESGLIALTDWTLYPHMTEVWRALHETVFARLAHRPRFFIDLVDPSARSEADIRAMLGVLQTLETVGPVTLSLNGTEANVVARAVGVESCPREAATATAAQATRLHRALGLSEIVIHRTRHAAAATATETADVEGPYCAHPTKTTGAGDRFNAGYALGALSGCDLRSRLWLAVAASGYFVRQARSATRGELSQFLREEPWGDPAS